MRVTGVDVRLVPPIVFMGWLVAGLLLDRVSALALPAWVRGPGWVLILAGVALMAWAVVVIRRAGTTLIPWQEVEAIVTTGPFGFSRNPIYLADTLVYAGISLAAATWTPSSCCPCRSPS